MIQFGKACLKKDACHILCFLPQLFCNIIFEHYNCLNLSSFSFSFEKSYRFFLDSYSYLSMVNYDLQKNLTGNPPDSFNIIVFDGGALIHLPSTVNIITFNQYGMLIICCPQAAGKIHSCRCCLGYLHITDSITREKKGKGIRRKVAGKNRVPGNWNDFLRDGTNKKELSLEK